MKPDPLHPYRGTAEEVMAQYDLSKEAQAKAWAEIERTAECPFFSKTTYMRAHTACAAQLNKEMIS